MSNSNCGVLQYNAEKNSDLGDQMSVTHAGDQFVKADKQKLDSILIPLSNMLLPFRWTSTGVTKVINCYRDMIVVVLFSMIAILDTAGNSSAPFCVLQYSLCRVTKRHSDV